MTKGSRKCDYTLQTLRLTWLCISLITILLCAQSFKLGFHDLCSSVGLFCLSCASVQLTVFSALMFICVSICPSVCPFVCVFPSFLYLSCLSVDLLHSFSIVSSSLFLSIFLYLSSFIHFPLSLL